MRISDSAFRASLVDQIDGQQSAITSLESELGSGRAITRPSDNPDGTVAALALRSEISQASSWKANLGTASSWLGVANTAAGSVVDALQQARTLVLEALNQGVQSPGTYLAIGQQLSGLRSDLLGLANTTFAGRPIFAGTSAGSVAYDSAGNYQGAGAAPQVVVGAGASPGQTLSMSVTGPDLFGSGGTSAFATLAQLARDLAAPGGPTTAELRAGFAAIDANLGQATGAAGTLGNLSARASSTSGALASRITQLQGDLGGLTAVNIPQVTTQLQTDMTNYQAALWAASKAIPLSLVEYL